jgi:hypothetical protein
MCHGRAWPGHPRLTVLPEAKPWMTGPSPVMTQELGRSLRGLS